MDWYARPHCAPRTVSGPYARSWGAVLPTTSRRLRMERFLRMAAGPPPLRCLFSHHGGLSAQLPHPPKMLARLAACLRLAGPGPPEPPSPTRVPPWPRPLRTIAVKRHRNGDVQSRWQTSVAMSASRYDALRTRAIALCPVMRKTMRDSESVRSPVTRKRNTTMSWVQDACRSWTGRTPEDVKLAALGSCLRGVSHRFGDASLE
ncbi:hypothetical protein OH76DRAFT_459935 [Lentinus brumalis]|uniref:Uncharacterized protein n=1 Tax=Lentinus brumalis TaxID=2498619 RepID=A0A371CIJ9_9APHY|nr:hypothetical protein OH76DRAFT_459935 [Polyporus brumalis]